MGEGVCCLTGVSTVFEEGEGCQDLSILVLVAALNEEKGIQLTLSELKHYLPSSMLLVVDGNSTDKTVHVAKSQGADVVFQKGKGKGDAISSGLQSINSDFDYVVITDADYTYPSKYVSQMIEILNSNPEIGMVCGNRFNSKLSIGAMQDGFYLGNKILAFVHDIFNGVSLNDPLTGLRVIRWNLIKNWRPKSSGFDIEIEMNNHVDRQGYQIVEIDISYRKRVGQKKLRFWDGFPIFKRIIAQSLYNSKRRVGIP